jgi:hypothetical protein
MVMKKNFTAFSIVLFSAVLSTGVLKAQTPTLKKKAKTASSVRSAASQSKAAGSSFIVKSEHGQVNWTDQYVEAEGSSIMDTTRFKLKNQAKLMAQRGAIVVAQRNLLEIVNGVLVEGQTSVKDLVVVSDDVKTKVSGVLKGAVQVGKTQYEDGVATVKLRIPLYADGLGEAVDTTPAPAKPEVDPSVVIPQDSVPTNVMVSVSGDYKPQLFPKLKDEQGNVVVDMGQTFDPNKGKGPSIVQQSATTLENMKGKKGVDLIEAAVDGAGNLVLKEKSRARLEKWKKAGLIAWGIVKKLILPI